MSYHYNYLPAEIVTILKTLTKYSLLFLIPILFDPKLEQPKKHDNNEPLVRL